MRLALVLSVSLILSVVLAVAVNVETALTQF